ncbi:hypothetical protein INT47_010336 [Mucor saturninus]|uniref:BTB domain-containing protein n=1 Tax=Mucor saturninus TaxID=64648 RepID=A0A8H7QL35_9FUNG|nr:hypothetical protein INT47_010336 [Mucor saturninus]
MSRDIPPKDSTVIKLNVGGITYHTTYGTLKMSPYFRQLLFNGTAGLDKLENGEILIDRDGYLFNRILEYLRCSEVSDNELEELRNEAEFYMLREMIECIDNMLVQRSYSVKKEYMLTTLEELKQLFSLSSKNENVGIDPLYKDYELISVVDYAELKLKCTRHNEFISECQKKDRRDCHQHVQLDGTYQVSKLLVAKKLDTNPERAQ